MRPEDEDGDTLMRRASGAAEKSSRIWLVALCSLCTALSYCDRVNLSVAVVTMSKELGWGMEEKSIVLSAFFKGYIWSQIPGAYFAKRFGGHIVLGTCAILWSIATLLLPWLATFSYHHVALGRFALGVFEGVVFPTIYHLFSSRVPKEERSRSLAGISIGVFSGAIFSFLVTPVLVERYGWPSVFYFFGLVGFAWGFAWFWFTIRCEKRGGNEIPLPCFSTPVQSKVKSGDAPKHGALELWAEFRHICFRPISFAIMYAHFCHNFGSFIIMSWLPTYFSEQLGISGTSLSLTCLPYICMGVAVAFSSFFADGVIAQERLSLSQVRRNSTLIGFGVAAIFVALVGGGVRWPILCLCVSLSGLAAAPVSGYEAAKMDVCSPEYVGKFQSISNTLAAFAGIVGIPLAAYVKELSGSWNGVFVMLHVVYLSAMLVYARYGSYSGKVIV